MKRPILIITLGFITGIIGGLYFNIVPFIFLCFSYITLILKVIDTKAKNKNKYKNKYKYIKILYLFINNNILLLFLISAFISSIYLIYSNKKYEAVYNNFLKEKILATVISNKKETEYKEIYAIKLQGYKNINFLLRISKSKKISLNFGDNIKIDGEYVIPEGSRNYGGFNYKEYLKTQKIYGIFEANNVQIIDSDNDNVGVLEKFSNTLKQKIINNINRVLPKSTRDLFLGILIGYDENLSEDIQDSFRKSSLTHLLAVSGAHIAYIIIGINFLFSKFKIPKRITGIFTIIFLIFFMYLTDFSSSVVRATIMGIIMIISLIFLKKNDVFNSISISLLIILLDNPFKILDIGLILSYFATIGIICFSKINKEQKEEGNIYKKIIYYLKELISITIFANIFVIPIMIYNFNAISFTFIISNLFAGILIGPITIGGFVLIIISLISIKLAYIISIPYNLLLELLVQSTKLTSVLPFSEILVPTPNVYIIIGYYLFLVLYMIYIILKKEYYNRYIVKKIIYVISKFILFLKKKYKIIIMFFLMFIIISFCFSTIILKKLKIYFIDVGQGDSSLIITPTNKKILIDSGGAETGNFDVGKNVLVPYLLDRKITYLDYICISHFDSDHCKGFIYLLNNIHVKNIIISEQYDVTDNFKKIIEIAKRKNINILKVKMGDILKIDKYVLFKILHPRELLTHDINNNSIVMKLEYLGFSCLFTGDISKQVEQDLIIKYGNYLKSDILKIAHHGSYTSSNEEFLKIVKPKISLIGVGKNNKFGHPNEKIIKSLEAVNSKIYRTDLCGEIILEINNNRKHKSEYSHKIFCIMFVFLVNNTKEELMQRNDIFE